MTSAVKIKKKDGGENVQQQREGVLYTRNLILRAVSAVYLIAFVTFYHQSAGKLYFLKFFEIFLNFYKKTTYRSLRKKKHFIFFLKVNLNSLVWKLDIELDLILSLFGLSFITKLNFPHEKVL